MFLSPHLNVVSYSMDLLVDFVWNKDALERNQEFLVAFGKRARALRNEKGFSMRALADIPNMDIHHISRVESLQINTSIMMADDLAAGMRLGELFDFEPDSGC